MLQARNLRLDAKKGATLNNDGALTGATLF